MGTQTMDFQRWRENRRLRKAIFPGPSLDEVGMAVGVLTAAVCVWEEMQRRGVLVAILLGALVAWGFYGAYRSFSALKWRHDEYERRLRESGHAP